MTHQLDKDKIRDFLEKRGWKKGSYGEYVRPQHLSDKDVEQEWTEAILQGIVCTFEEKKKETEKFLKEHPTARR